MYNKTTRISFHSFYRRNLNHDPCNRHRQHEHRPWVLEGKKTYFIERLSTDKAKTELEYAVSLKNVLELYEIPVEQIEGGIISSVVPQVTELCGVRQKK